MFRYGQETVMAAAHGVQAQAAAAADEKTQVPLSMLD